jgi:translation initiation factor 2B subunit (eIF-2B alpha/beta/delta family)
MSDLNKELDALMQQAQRTGDKKAENIIRSLQSQSEDLSKARAIQDKIKELMKRLYRK